MMLILKNGKTFNFEGNGFKSFAISSFHPCKWHNIDRSSLVNGGFDICKDWSITYMNVYVKSKLISNVNCKLGQSETAN